MLAVQILICLTLIQHVCITNTACPLVFALVLHKVQYHHQTNTHFVLCPKENYCKTNNTNSFGIFFYQMTAC